MAHFNRVPSGERISGHVVTVAPSSVTIGLWGYLDFGGIELRVTSSNPRITVTPGAISGNSRQWVVTGVAGQDARLEAVPTTGGALWDFCEVHFRSGAHGGEVAVRSILEEIFGTSSSNHLIPATVPGHQLINMATFRAGDASNTPDFTFTPAKQARLGVFAARRGSVERAAILLLPETGAPDRVLVGITQGFGQNTAYYQSLGWSNPLSPRLITDVARRFVRERWAPQMLASKKNMAMLLPVRAEGDELGPFRDGAFLRQVLEFISVATLRAFTYAHVEMFTYSSGIGDLNGMLPSVQSNLSLEAVYNLDPAGGHAASARAGVARRQFLSGQTTHGSPRAGFEFLPLSRWANEQDFPAVNPRISGQAFNYLHNGVLPGYCLYLGIQTS
jgi:hypothetical protein